MRSPVVRALAGVAIALPLAWGTVPPPAAGHAEEEPAGQPDPGSPSDAGGQSNPGSPSRPSDPGGEPGASGDVDPDRPAEDWPEVEARSTIVRLMVFPVGGAALYDSTFGACRGQNCERRHMGNDIFAPKMRPLLAAQAGTVTWLRTDASGNAGNGVGITDAEGWRYLYLHVNNDTPGTDDGANPPEWRFAPGIAHGTFVHPGQVIAFLGDSGNAETTPPHLHFELRMPDRVTIDPYPSLLVADAVRRAPFQ